MSVLTNRTSEPDIVLEDHLNTLTAYIKSLGDKLDELELDKEVTQSPALNKHLDNIHDIYQWTLLENEVVQTLLTANTIRAEHKEHIEKQKRDNEIN